MFNGMFNVFLPRLFKVLFYATIDIKKKSWGIPFKKNCLVLENFRIPTFKNEYKNEAIGFMGVYDQYFFFMHIAYKESTIGPILYHRKQLLAQSNHH